MAQPNYSGRWRFAPEASALQIETPDLVVFTIDHREPSFHLERTLTFGDRSDTFSIDLMVGADPVPLTRGDATLLPALRWEAGRLLFLTRIVRGGREATNLVRYRLEEGGAVLVAEESYRGPEPSYDNRWVFTKQ